MEQHFSTADSVSDREPIAFELEVDGDRYTTGSTGAFLEDYEAASVTIRPLEE
ncbi:hypothetical protein [Natrinema sp. DC36]|uniref:hypothetical protein n=1 Tax=Natrinema sp. DC36 TaxID=2878680 RepID=UPI001CF062AB|nr:hypothetical protein [Natrinema sp. DC36]